MVWLHRCPSIQAIDFIHHDSQDEERLVVGKVMLNLVKNFVTNLYCVACCSWSKSSSYMSRASWWFFGIVLEGRWICARWQEKKIICHVLHALSACSQLPWISIIAFSQYYRFLDFNDVYQLASNKRHLVHWWGKTFLVIKFDFLHDSAHSYNALVGD